MPDENTTIKYKQLLDEGEPFYPMVGKSSYSEWIGYEEIDGTPPTDDFVLPVQSGGTGADNANDALSNLGWEVKSVSVTLSASNLTFSNVYCFQFGKIVILGFDVTTSVAINTGGATQSFGITGFPTPVSTYIWSRTMTGTATLDIYIGKSGSSGDCGIRNNGTTNVGANTLLSSCYFVYVAE